MHHKPLWRLTQIALSQRMLRKKKFVPPAKVQKTWQQVKDWMKDFRLYNLASYALNRATPRAGYQVKSHLAYGLKARQRLDLYISQRPHTKQPLIVFVHGGAWKTGDKKSYRFLGQAFATQGFHVAVLNYHLAPEHIFPSSIDDLSLALSFLHEKQKQLGIQTEHVILMGHSAGAFNVMSLLYHPREYHVHCMDNIRAVIGLAGPYHFDYVGDPICADAFDQNVPYTEVMPYYFVKANQIRHYLFRAANDSVVGAYNATDLAKALALVGNHHQVTDIEKTGHVSLVGSLAHWFSPHFATKQKVLAALYDSLKD